jgi:hypothetical protein
MADHDDWTADDDARLRAVLGSLRADVEGAPLPDVRFVKARGMARRRQRLLTWTAAAAAAAVVVGTVGYSELGRDTSLQTPPAGRSSTTSDSPSPTTTSPTTPTAEPPFPSIVPTAGEWQQALGLASAPRIFVPQETGLVECVDSIPDALDTHESVEATADNVQGSQVHWLAPTTTKGPSTAKAIADQVADCALPAFKVTGVQTSSWPRLYSYTAGDAGSGWFAIVLNAGDVTLLQVVDPGHAVSTVTKAQVSELAARALARLKAFGGSHENTIDPPVGPKAINEKMPVAGADPLPSSDLFVAASQWTSTLFAGGAPAYAGKADTAPSIGGLGVFCETDEYLSGIGGQFGIVQVRAGKGDANVVGRQRVRVDQSTDKVQAKDSVLAQLAEANALLVKGCAESDGKVTAAQGPSAGTYLLTKKVTGEASGTDYRWVGITPLATPGAWTTIVFSGTSDKQGFQGSAAEGFAELDRLLALARQK